MKNFWMCFWIIASVIFLIMGGYYMIIAKQIDYAALCLALSAINYCNYLGYAKQDEKEE